MGERQGTIESGTGALGFNLGAIMAAIALVGLAGAYLLQGALRAEIHRPTDDSNRVAISVGGTALTIPSAWIAAPAEVQGSGFAKDVRLEVSLPLAAGGKPALLDITILQRSRVRTSASLLDGVYLHQFQDKEVTGPAGLVGKPLNATEGYQNETVWYDPLAADPFVAKCAAPPADGTEAQCLRIVNLAPGLAAIYSFAPAALAGWRQFDAAVAPLLKQIGAL
jgi:hypothetical protein